MRKLVRTVRNAFRYGEAGFTLIELLVVIGIICILAAILFPVFARAREKGRQTVCLSNMKQLAYAVYMYAGENDEFMPPYWVPVWDFANPTAKGNYLGALIPYLKTLGVFRCPSGIPNLSGTNYNPTGYSDTNYMGNAAIMGKTIGKNKNPAGIAYLQECAEHQNVAWYRPEPLDRYNPIKTSEKYRYWHDYSTWKGMTREWQSNNHFGGGNLVYCDGHAEWKPYKLITSGDFGLVPGNDYCTAPNDKIYTALF